MNAATTWQTGGAIWAALGEDGDKSNDCRCGWSGLTGGQILETQSTKTKSGAMGGDDVLASLRRMANLRKVQRLAQSGVLVVSDRFPQAEISGFIDGLIGVERDREKSAGFWRSVNGVYPKKMAQYRPELIIRLGIDIDTISPRSTAITPSCRTKSVLCRRLAITAQNFEIDSRAPTARCWNRHRRRFLWCHRF